MIRMLKKTIAVCLIGFGLRYTNGIITSCYMVVIYNWSCYYCCRYNVAYMLKKGDKKMVVVVKKVPKCLRGFVKFIFGIKDK